ncbi:hypothetical protein ACFPOI_21640 [Nonomuraea angiospora]|uniref:Uncharacterized protein n=1 Tax=Nonomuraea angiospora TaxID=46172 RepID=A0ABR9MK07_9ACTN|nr:hypothetical protein [Nonomuraea angiospora]MBE1593271.1 hypothetical protein [Nonomuraea angiospora]
MQAASALLAAVLLVGCGGNTTTTVPREAAVATGPAAFATPTPGFTSSPGATCPASGNNRRLAKTRFALHAGLALGAFHRYIYKPLRSGGFKAGAEKRKRSFLKAAVAGAFALHQVKVARGFAMANPTLCKGLDSVHGAFTNLTGKLKSGTATPADLDAGKASLDGLVHNASKTGVQIKEQPVTVPGAS